MLLNLRNSCHFKSKYDWFCVLKKLFKCFCWYVALPSVNIFKTHSQSRFWDAVDQVLSTEQLAMQRTNDTSSRFKCSTLNSSFLKYVSYGTMRPLFANEISWVKCLELSMISLRSVLVTLRRCMYIDSEMRDNNATMLSTNSLSSSLNSETKSAMSNFKTRPLILCLIHHLSRSLISWQSSGAFKNGRTRLVKSYSRSRKVLFLNLLIYFI